MSAVAVIRYLLANAAAVTAVVPATRILPGVPPVNTAMPALAVTKISGTEALTVAMTESGRMHTERVQVTAYVKQAQAAGTDYPGLEALLTLVGAACANRNGTVNGVRVDSILPAGEGPDIPPDESMILERSRDFIVKWL